eukprot:s1_g2517.t1
MKDEKPKCCFQVYRADLEKMLHCQFDGEPQTGSNLVKVGTSYYCPYHLPFETAVEFRDNNDVVTLPSSRLKTKWTEDRSAQFAEDVLRRLQRALANNEICDLTGVVFPANFECDNLTLPGVSFYKAHFAGGHANFTGSTFRGRKSDFALAVFSGGAADFSNVRFLGDSADFSEAQFLGGDANFESTSFFVNIVSFLNAKFSEGDAVFRNTIFLKDSDEEGSAEIAFENEGERELWLEEERRHYVELERDLNHTDFYSGANFDGAEFDHDAQFAGTNFANGPVRFRNAKFGGYLTDFENAKFRKRVTSFIGTKFFSNSTSFESTDFATAATLFEASEFIGHNTSFANATFSSGPAEFSGALFKTIITDFTASAFSGGSANFSSAQFPTNDTYFCDVAFDGGAVNFTAPYPSSREDEKRFAFGDIDFRGAKFSTTVDFGNRAFQGKTYFDGVIFGGLPEFHGSSLHQDTTFPSMGGFRNTKATGAAQAYRTLRLAMKQQEAHEEEAMFWALEQRSKRKHLKLNPLKTWRNTLYWTPWMLSGFYALLSNYGLSINRPLTALASWLFAATPLSYFCLRADVDKLFGTVSYWELFGFSLAQSVRPFFIWGDYEGDGIKSVLGANVDVLSVKLFATADSLISLVLIALLILAVRRRFRMQ